MLVAKSNSTASIWKSGILLMSFVGCFLTSFLPVAAFATPLDLGTVNQLTIGSATLSIKHPTENTIAAYMAGDEEPLFQGERSDYQETAGEVLYRIKYPAGEAVAVGLHNAGDIDETSYILLVDQKTQGFQKIDFGSKTVTFGGQGRLTRTKQGFQFEQPALPSRSGKWLKWSFAKGITTGSIPYVPSGGRNMVSFYQSKDIRKLEPLDNKGFYDAVLKLPTDDRDRLVVSMSGIGNQTCECSGAVDTDTYGTRKTRDLLAFSNCGLEFDGHILSCFGADGLAVWERKSGKFFFAINSVADGDRHDRSDDSLHFYPDAVSWSAAAKLQLDDWQAETLWLDD